MTQATKLQLVAPTNFTSNSQTATSITLSWTVATNADGYKIQSCEGASCTDFADAKTINDGSTTSTTISSLTHNTTYKFKIKTTGNGTNELDSSYSSTLSQTTKLQLSTPTNLSSTAQTLTSITLSWTAVTNADGYLIQSCSGATCTNFADAKTINSGSTITATIDSLTQNTTYKFRIKATGTGSNEVDSSYSSAISQATNLQLSIPSGLSSPFQTLTSITLSWSAVTNADGYLIQSCSGATCTNFADAKTIDDGDTTTTSISSLTQNTTYKFKIKATGNGTNEVDSTYSSAISQSTKIQLSTPSGFSSTSQTSTSITLSWTAVTNANGYKVQKCSGDTCTNFSDAKTISGGNTTSTIVSSLTNNTTYKFRIKATGSGSNSDSAYSTAITQATKLKLSSPANLTVTSKTSTSVSLSWSSVTNADGYVIQFCVGASCSDFADTKTISSGSTLTTTISSLATDTTYSFRIRATGSGSNEVDSDHSSSITATTLGDQLSTPTNLSSTAQTTTSITLSWTAVTDAEGYKIQSCSGATCTDFTDAKTISGGNTTTTIISSLTSNTTYKFKIKATSSGADDSAYSSAISQATKLQLSTPASFSSSSQTLTSITLSWSAVTNAEGYVVQYCSGATCTNFSNSRTITGGSITSTTISSLTANTTYKFRIKATGTGSNEIDSAYSSAITQATKVQLSTPASFSSSSQTDTTVSLSWTAVTNADGYLIQSCSGASCTNFTGAKTINDGSTTSTTISSLSASTTYRFRIKATGTGNNMDSSYSTAVSATTKTKLSTPTGFGVSYTDFTYFNMFWNAVTNVSSYQIQQCTSGCNSESNWSNSTMTVNGANVTVTQVVNLSSGTTYNFRIKAVGTGSYIDSDYSSTITRTTNSYQLSTPTNLNIQYVDYTYFNVYWSTVTNGSTYQVQHCEGSGCTNFANSNMTTNGSAGNTQVTGLNSGTTYTLRVKAVGHGSYTDSEYSSTIERTTNSNQLSTPTGFGINYVDFTYLNMRWNAVTNASSYNIQQCTSGCSNDSNWSDSTMTVNGADTVATQVTGLTPATTYEFRIKAVGTGSYSDSSYSDTITRTTNDNRLTTPTGFAVSSVNLTSIGLTWNSVTNASGYVIQMCALSCNSNSGWSDAATISSGSTTSTTISPLGFGITYQFKIKATGTGNYVDSNYSSTLTQATLSP